jgi:hypothetical protein
MKKYCIGILMLAVIGILMVSGCVLVEPKAEVEITDQTDEGSPGDYYKQVNYTIENTGLYLISYWEIQFRITIESSSYDGYAYGYDLAVGEDHASFVDIDTGSDDTTGYNAIVYDLRLEKD